jgi:hypothetical protein
MPANAGKDQDQAIEVPRFTFREAANSSKRNSAASLGMHPPEMFMVRFHSRGARLDPLAASSEDGWGAF